MIASLDSSDDEWGRIDWMRHYKVSGATDIAKYAYGCGYWGNAPLHLAAEAGYLGVVELFLSGKASVDARNAFLDTPLHDAAWAGHTGVVECLAAAGADVNARDDQGCTPLHEAAYNGKAKVAELLMGPGAHVNASDKRPKVGVPGNLFYFLPLLEGEITRRVLLSLDFLDVLDYIARKVSAAHSKG